MLTPDTVLQGRYRVVSQLGQGGMGTVYEALDERLDTTVALKETFFADEKLRKQFEREARLLARLHHPALPRVSDHFSEGEGQFLVMQFIPGDDLAEMMTRRPGPFPADQVLIWADQLLDALDYLHTQEPQIVHRDIKPQNLKLTARGQIILLDFGLAKGQAGEISRVSTAASIFGYTPNYAPLEQIQGLGTDARSDLYSLAATIYHLLTGVKPPDALSRAAAMVNGQPDPLQFATDINASVAPEVSEVLQKAMAQNRDQRFANAADMRKALQRTEQTATVINRGEAQTVLFPSAGKTVGAATQPVEKQRTVASGETTVVRPLVSGPSRRIMPWAISGIAVAVLAACVVGFFVMKNNDSEDDHLVQASPTPTPGQSATPKATTALQTVNPNPDPRPSATPVKEATPKKTEKPAKTETPKSTPTPDTEPPEEHEGDPRNAPDVPRDPSGQPIPRPQGVPRVPTTRVMPGGVVIRNFPDGSQIITTPDGMRVFVRPDGSRQVLNPGKKQNRRRPGQ